LCEKVKERLTKGEKVCGRKGDELSRKRVRKRERERDNEKDTVTRMRRQRDNIKTKYLKMRKCVKRGLREN
jgi:hypothetical protein